MEPFGGYEKASVDIMRFRFFKNRNRANSPWLFFNRNRASVDYRINVAEGAFLPQFGFQRRFQCGAGTDLDQSESPIFVWGFNIGGFVRQQF